jgi:hypothetical protein
MAARESSMIELDLSRPWNADDPFEDGDNRPVRGWRNPPPWLVPALLVVAIAALVGGAAVPPKRDPVLAQRIPNAGLTFGRDDTAFLYQQRARSGRLQAYRLDRPGALWTVDYPGSNPVPTVTTDPGVVLVSTYASDPSREANNRIEARDSQTGRRLWQHSGLGMVDAGVGVLVVSDHRGWGGNVELNRPSTVAGLELRSGATRWSHTTDVTTLLSVQRAALRSQHGSAWAGAQALVELDLDGTLRVLDPVTGTVRSTLRLPLTGPPLGLMIQDGMAVVSEGRPGDDPLDQNRAAASIVGYDLVTGEAHWRGEAPDFAIRCGERYLCRYGPHELTVTDPKSGDVRYRGDSDRVTFRGDLMLVSRGNPVDASAPNGSELWDLTTGRRLRSFGPWRIVTDDPRDGNLAAQTGAGGVLMVAVLDLRTGAARVIGRAGDWIGDAYCTFGHRYVGCTGPGGVRIWRAPDGVGPVNPAP